jgi:hypothetical protein
MQNLDGLMLTLAVRNTFSVLLIIKEDEQLLLVLLMMEVGLLLALAVLFVNDDGPSNEERFIA